MSLNFSERMGIKPRREIIQRDSIDEPLRIKLWNMIAAYCWRDMENDDQRLINHDELRFFVELLWHEYFEQPTDTIGRLWGPVHATIRKHFFSCQWNRVYDFVEFVATYYPWERQKRADFFAACQAVLEAELSAYRFVDRRIVPLTSSEEIAAVEEAASFAGRFKPVSDHLRQAIGLFSDRQTPDFRNSIKESISAIEALGRILTGDPQVTLGKALRRFDDAALHPALKEAFSKLYGYTSEADGIRHALMNGSNLTQDDAKFMLIACSAFANYLIAKSATPVATAAP